MKPRPLSPAQLRLLTALRDGDRLRYWDSGKYGYYLNVSSLERIELSRRVNVRTVEAAQRAGLIGDDLRLTVAGLERVTREGRDG